MQLLIFCEHVKNKAGKESETKSHSPSNRLTWYIYPMHFDPAERGFRVIEWSLRAFANMRAVRLFLRPVYKEVGSLSRGLGFLKDSPPLQAKCFR